MFLIRPKMIWLVAPGERAGTQAVQLTISFLVEVFERNARQLAGAV